jgi:hypothetical protein
MHWISSTCGVSSDLSTATSRSRAVGKGTVPKEKTLNKQYNLRNYLLVLTLALLQYHTSQSWAIGKGTVLGEKTLNKQYHLRN